MISVAIVDDQRDIREGLRNILLQAEGFSCIGTYADGESAHSSIPPARPDVVLMDIELPDMSGIECVKLLKRQLPDLNVIVLSAYTDDRHVFDALRAGAFGYLTKAIFPSRLLSAIREVNRGGAPLDARIARRVVASFNCRHADLDELSSRERDVLSLLCEGQSYKAMANQLFVSPNTIRFHLKNIYKKLEVSSRHEAMVKASRVGFA